MMNKNNVAVAEAFYTAMGEKNIAALEQYLHPEVHFIGPVAELKGKGAYLEGLQRFITLFKTLTIRAKFGSGDQAMLAYDLDIPAPAGKFSVAALLTFQEELIAKIELFCDGRPFDK